MKESKYLSGVVSLQLDVNRCVGCGACLEVCPRAVFRLEAGKAAYVDRDRCIECGACALNCPVDALSVEVGVGCATAYINRGLGRKGACCCTDEQCCTADRRATPAAPSAGPACRCP